MILTEKQGLKHLLKISYPYIVFCLLYSLFIISVEEYLTHHIYRISSQLASVFGLAVAFFLGFRMNSAYDRWWEARKLFGELTNNTGSFSNKIYVYFSNEINLARGNSKALTDEALTLTMLYVKQLKNEMHDKFHPSVTNENAALFGKYGITPEGKLTHEILIALSQMIEKNFAAERPFEKNDLMLHINRYYDIQGKAERIKNTPFLKIYSVFTRITVFAYVLMLPIFIGDIDFGAEETMLELLSIPIIVLLGSVFLTINQLATLFGEPFSEEVTSVPIDEICANILRGCQQVNAKLDFDAANRM